MTSTPLTFVGPDDVAVETPASNAAASKAAPKPIKAPIGMRRRAQRKPPLPRAARPKLPEPTPGAKIVSSALATIAIALLGFVVYVAAISGLKHARAQHLAYADFRKELALGTAPTGPTDPNDPNHRLALGAPVAVISIPAIGVNEVVFEGTSGTVLEKGPGHLRTTVLPGQAGTSVLYGRATAYGGPFGDISQLREGDRITVTTGQGIQQYTVTGVRRAGDPIPPALAANKGRLTLDTADGPPLLASGVIRVDADLTSPTQSRPTQIVSASDLRASEPLLATDRDAWISLVLWGQLLLIAAVLLALAAVQWGRRQALVVAVPVIGFFAFGVAESASLLLPNLT